MKLLERIVTAFAATIYYPLLFLARGLGATGQWLWRHKGVLLVLLLISPVVIWGIASGLELTVLRSLMTGILLIYFAVFIAAGSVVELNKPGGGIGLFTALVALATGSFGIWKIATTLGWW